MSETASTLLLKKLMPTLNGIDADADWQVVGPIVRARKCNIFKVIGPHQHFAVKVFKAGIASNAAPEIQYKALRRCNKAAEHTPLLRAPKALALLPEERAILMAWHTAPTLRTMLWRKSASPKQRLNLINRSGAWLQTFHSLSEINPQPLDGSKLSAKLITQIEKKPAAEDQLKKSPHFQRALSRFHEAAATCTDHTSHALLHGDFTPSNLLSDGESIVGMDMWGVRRAPIYEDIARMLAYLGVVSPYALQSAPLAPESPMMQAFIHGYGSEHIDLTSTAFPIVLLYQQLRRWLVYADKKAKRPFSATARWQLVQNQRLSLQTLNWLDHCN